MTNLAMLERVNACGTQKETSFRITIDESLHLAASNILSNQAMIMIKHFWLLLGIFLHVGAIAPPGPKADDETQEFYESFDEIYFELQGVVPDQETPNYLWDRRLADENTLVTLTRDTGVVRALVLLVRFTDHVDKILPPMSEINTLFTADEIDTLLAPTGSIKSYLKANSDGRLNFEAEVVDWKMTNNTELYFASDTNGKPVYGVTHQMKYAMYPILDQLDADGFDFSRFDGNNDGYIDVIVLLHSGFAAELGNADCFTKKTSESRIWSHAMTYSPNPWVSKTKNNMAYKSHAYAVSAGIRGYCKSRVPRLGVITHEVLHTFGLPDLFGNLGFGIGHYDIMSYPYGRSGSQIHPSFLSPWSKIQIKWLDPIPIEYDGLYTIKASEMINQTYIIQKGYPDGEYLLIENRQNLTWDALLYNGGLLIWHIDDTQVYQKYRGYPQQEGWPGNGNHYQIALEQADRQYHLETVSLESHIVRYQA
jgi:M6 family metalloprotease-like protein